MLLGIHSSVPLEGGLSPAEAVMGCQPLLPGQFLSVGEPPLDDFLESLRATALKSPRPVSHKNKTMPTALPPELMNTEFVFVRKDGVSTPLAQPYNGPYRYSAVPCTAFNSKLVTDWKKYQHTVLRSVTRRRTPPSPPRPVEAGRRQILPLTPVMVRNHLNKTPESPLRKQSTRKMEADFQVQVTFLAQQSQLLEKILLTPARGRHRVKNRRAHRGL